MWTRKQETAYKIIHCDELLICNWLTKSYNESRNQRTNKLGNVLECWLKWVNSNKKSGQLEKKRVKSNFNLLEQRERETFLRERARRLLSSFAGFIEWRMSLTVLKAWFCRGRDISKALTRMLMWSSSWWWWWRCFCSTSTFFFFFCIKLFKNLLLLSNSSSAPSILSTSSINSPSLLMLHLISQNPNMCVFVFGVGVYKHWICVLNQINIQDFACLTQR